MPIAYFLIALQYGRFFCAIKKAASATTLTADKRLIGLARITKSSLIWYPYLSRDLFCAIKKAPAK